MRRMGFRGGRVIDPGSGIGHFAGLMPGDIGAGSSYLGIEMDRTSAEIAKHLYPEWSVRNENYADVRLGDGIFDAAVGNPPFAQITPADRKYDKHRFLLHDYFFAKTMDALAPGKAMAFVTSAGTMNKLDPKARQYLHDRADLMAAVRLPNTAFKQNAGTEVTTDVLFLRKRREGEPKGDDTWLRTVPIDLPTRRDPTGPKVAVAVNQYFLANPRAVLGRPALDTLVAGNRYAVDPFPDMNLGEQLAGQLAEIPEDVYSYGPTLAGGPKTAETNRPETSARMDVETPETKDGSYYLAEDGELMQFRDGIGQEPRRVGGSGKVVKLTRNQHELIRQLIPIRNAYRDVLEADTADDSEAGDRARAKLNATYDAFTAANGPLNKKVSSQRKPSNVQKEKLRQSEREAAREKGEYWDDGDFDDAEIRPRRRDAGRLSPRRARPRATSRCAKDGRSTRDRSIRTRRRLSRTSSIRIWTPSGAIRRATVSVRSRTTTRRRARERSAPCSSRTC